MIEQTFKHNSKKHNLKSCILSKEDMKRLYVILDEKKNEAMDIEIREIKKLDNIENDKQKELIKNINDSFKNSISIWGTIGDFYISSNVDFFNENNFPKKISRISYDCVHTFRFRNNYEPRNRFTIDIEFYNISLLDLSNSDDQHKKELNIFQVSGSNPTWVNGVTKELEEFFSEHIVFREFIHAKSIPDFLLIFPILPLVFWIANQLNNSFGIIESDLNILLKLSIFIPFILSTIIIFRILINWMKWTFPYYEYKDENNNKRKYSRRFIWWLIGSISLPIVIDIIVAIIK